MIPLRWPCHSGRCWGGSAAISPASPRASSPPSRSRWRRRCCGWRCTISGRAWRCVGVALAVWVIAGSLNELALRLGVGLPLDPARIRERARGLPRSAWSMTLAHIGLGVLVLGITVQSAGQVERIIVMRPGDTVEMVGYQVRLDDVGPAQGPNYQRAARHLQRIDAGANQSPCSIPSGATSRSSERRRPRPASTPISGAISISFWASRCRWRRFRGPALLQSACPMDLGRGRDHGAGRCLSR